MIWPEKTLLWSEQRMACFLMVLPALLSHLRLDSHGPRSPHRRTGDAHTRLCPQIHRSCPLSYAHMERSEIDSVSHRHGFILHFLEALPKLPTASSPLPPQRPLDPSGPPSRTESPSNALPRTGVGVETLAVEHLCLLDVADAPMVAGVGVAGVVATLAHPTAIQHIAAFLPQVVHLVVHIQEADAALQANRSRSTLCHSERTKDMVGGGEKHQHLPCTWFKGRSIRMPWATVQRLYSHSHLVLGSSSNKEVGVEVEPIGTRGALPTDVGLPIHSQHAAAAVAVHHQLVPLARLHAHLAGDDARARACVKPGAEDEEG